MLGKGAPAGAKVPPENGLTCNSFGLRLLTPGCVLAFGRTEPSASRAFAKPISGVTL